MSRMKVSEALAKMLTLSKVEYAFLMTGVPLDIFPAIHDEGIKLILTRSEKAAAYMADGYSRVSSKPGICYGQKGPGASNLAAGLAEPHMASSSVIAITGATSTRSTGKAAYQELDQLPLFDSVTKWNVSIIRGDRIPEIIRNAFRTALTGKGGPVHIDLPEDVAASEADFVDIYADSAYASYPSIRCRPDPNAVKLAAELLLKAERPVLIVGLGALVSGACDEIAQFAELLEIPVATTLSGKGVIPENHPLSIGVVGAYSRKCANDAVEESDLVFFVGCSIDGMVTDAWRLPGREAKIIHLDIDPYVFGRNYRTEVSLYSDAQLGLIDVMNAIKEIEDTARPVRASWASKVKFAVTQWREEVKKISASDSVPIKPQRVIMELRSLLDPADILAADTGYMSAWTGVLYDVLAKGRTFIRAAGSLGWAFPAALGAKLAAPDKKVVCVTGDGGFTYHLAELETALRHRIPAVAVVLNNKSLAFEHHILKYYYQGKAFEIADYEDVNFGKIANSFGCFGIRVERPAEIREALINAFNSGKPAVVDIVVDKEEYGPVTYYEKIAPRVI